jgi:RNA polymerase sigma-70 factor (ECF subfamily)
MDDPKKLSTQALLQLCLDSQDKEIAMALWAEFVRRFQPLIAGVVTKCVFRRGRANPALVDDLVQETYLKLCANNFKALRNFEFKHENGLFGFLKVIAGHVVEDHFRRKNPLDESSEDDIYKTMPGPPSQQGTPRSMEREILYNQIDNCLREQAAEPNFLRNHKIFWLYYRDGLTSQAIAALPDVDLGVKGVESLLLRLIRLIRGKLGWEDDDEE